MAKSLRSKRMRRNRREKRKHTGPIVTERLKKALAFEYNDQTEKAHLSMFHDVLNGPPPKVPGSNDPKISKMHLTEGHVWLARRDRKLAKVIPAAIEKASVALTRGANWKSSESKDAEKETSDTAEEMDTKEKKIFDEKSLKDQFGSYPVWMNQKKVKKIARKDRKLKAKVKRLALKGKTLRRSRLDDIEMEGESDGEVDKINMI